MTEGLGRTAQRLMLEEQYEVANCLDLAEVRVRISILEASSGALLHFDGYIHVQIVDIDVKVLFESVFCAQRKGGVDVRKLLLHLFIDGTHYP